MQVFIMRHGDAALEAASDAVRPLTLCGCDESRQMASWLNSKMPEIDKVLVSPYLRAGQTLATVREALKLPEGQEVLPELTPGGDPGMVACHLQALAIQGVHAVLVISHLPLVGYLVSELCPHEAPALFSVPPTGGPCRSSPRSGVSRCRGHLLFFSAQSQRLPAAQGNSGGCHSSISISTSSAASPPKSFGA